MTKQRGFTQKDIDCLIELNDLIKSYERAFKDNKNIYLVEYEEILNNLKSDWNHIANAAFPNVEAYGKIMNFKTFLRNEKISIKKEEKKVKVKTESLSALINKKENETNLVLSIYDKNYVTDIPDPNRKRKRK